MKGARFDSSGARVLGRGGSGGIGLGIERLLAFYFDRFPVQVAE